MADKGLLELAAKAALLEYHHENGIIRTAARSGGYTPWNPLKDDGDALRLANHLCMSVSTGPCTARATTIAGALRGAFFEEDTCHQDQDEAVRRVIVRCAAEVGEAKP